MLPSAVASGLKLQTLKPQGLHLSQPIPLPWKFHWSSTELLRGPNRLRKPQAATKLHPDHPRGYQAYCTYFSVRASSNTDYSKKNSSTQSWKHWGLEVPAVFTTGTASMELPLMFRGTINKTLRGIPRKSCMEGLEVPWKFGGTLIHWSNFWTIMRRTWNCHASPTEIQWKCHRTQEFRNSMDFQNLRNLPETWMFTENPCNFNNNRNHDKPMQLFIQVAWKSTHGTAIRPRKAQVPWRFHDAKRNLERSLQSPGIRAPVGKYQRLSHCDTFYRFHEASIRLPWGFHWLSVRLAE